MGAAKPGLVLALRAAGQVARALPLVAAFLGPAMAQGQEPRASTEAPAEIVVTGTLIRGAVETGALPVTVLASEDLLRQGAPTVLDLVKQLPASAGALGDTNQFDARAQGTEGVTTINLRGLGPSRTLVLVNGRRLAEAPIGTAAVDLSLLPAAAIGRIEILRDGAAATYGSDAIAGVVNFISNSGFEGVRVTGDYRYIPGSNGDWGANILWGWAGSRARLLAAFGYQHRSPLTTTDRDFAFQPYDANPAGGWSQGGNPSAFIPFRIGAPGTGPTAGLMLDRGCGVLGGKELVQSRNPAGQPLLGRCATNFTSFDNLVEKEERIQAYAEGSFTLTDRLTFETSILYGYTEVLSNTSPTYLFLNTPSRNANPLGVQFFVPADNPGLAAYRALNPDQFPGGATHALLAAGTFRTSMVAGTIFGDVNGVPGASPAWRESESTRVTAGLRADLSEHLVIDAGMTWHHYRRRLYQFDTVTDRLQLALRGLGGDNCNGTTPGQGGCLWFNPFSNGVQRNVLTGETNPNFNPALANSPEVFRYFLKPLDSRLANRLLVGEAIASGRTPLALPGGPVSYALGVQYRNYQGRFRYGPFNDINAFPCAGSLDFGDRSCAVRTGLFGFLAPNADNDASLDVVALFGEAQLPVTDRLAISAALRFEDYGGAAGSTVDPKGTVRWEFLEGLALRGSVGTTFRGPPANLIQPDDRAVSFQFIGGAFRAVDVFDNPGLRPESAFTWSTGLTANRGGLTATVDYWSYRIEDQIVSEGIAGIVAAVFGPGATAATPANCASPLIGRFIFSGGPPTGGCGALTPTLGQVVRGRTDWVNSSDVRTSGIDFLVQYAHDFGAERRAAIGATGTYVLTYEVSDLFSQGALIQRGFDAVGKLNFQTTAYPIPDLRLQTFIEGSIGRHDLRLAGNFINGYIDIRPPAYRIPAFYTLDLSYNLTLPHDLVLNVTVFNLLNKTPGFARLDLNYDPFTANPIGRQVSFGLRKTFR
ncbi:TonB-dependent receptor domain-containing protein [Thermaurantiacus sp.]